MAVDRLDVEISEAESLALLHDLVALPSPSYEEAAAVRHLVQWMAAHGFEQAYEDAAGNAVGIIGQGPREVLLLGHIDTFGGFPPVHTSDGRLYGRGAVDAKGALCTFAAAAAQSRIAPDLRLVVVGAVEEEAASSKGARAVAASFRPDMCIIGEPSRWDRLTLAYKGRLLLEWRWHGGLAHSAGQQATAGERAFVYWQAVQQFCAVYNSGREGLFRRLDATLQEISTGQEGAYGRGHMLIGFRLPPGLAPQELAAALPPDPDAEIRHYGMEQAFVAEKDTALSRALRAAIRAEGGQPAFVHKTGTSDMNIVGPLWGCPILAYGPGDSALDHTPDEHIELEEYLRAVRVLAAALERL